jgi:uncharacterized protein Yka (UPF0111/DUF47 family)
MAVGKARIVGELAGSTLLLPDLVAQALAANERIKFALSWLQAAAANASGASDDDLGTERAVAGLADDPLYAPPDDVVRHGEILTLPRAGAVIGRIFDDLDCMRKPVEAAAAASACDPDKAAQFRKREESIRRSIALDGDNVAVALIASLARPPAPKLDTLHGLVMDMHRALNAIAASLAEEEIDGAKVYRLDATDRPQVAAFMRGLNRTAPLKFNHPGLATIAMRDSARLIVQNDIGTTDAHVLIVEVEAYRITVTYSDIHRNRLDFFARQLAGFSWTISNRQSPGYERDVFHVATGVFESEDQAALDAALERLGARLVFLIDWNRARKSLQHLVSRPEAVALLDWAAEHEAGHRGYLEAGGEALIADLLETVSKATGAVYVSLQRALGSDGAVEFLRQTLRITSEELRKGRSPAIIREVLRAELLAHVASVGERIIDLALDHAALTLELGDLVRRTLLDGRARASDASSRAKKYESAADHQVSRIRELCGSGRERAWRETASAADSIADSFEEAAFRLQFLADDIPPEFRTGLLRLAEHAVGGVKDYVRLLCVLRNIHRGAPRGDMRALLELADRLHEWEHATDDAARDIFSCLMGSNVDAKTFALMTAIADSLEESGDALLRSGRLICDHAMGDWFAV